MDENKIDWLANKSVNHATDGSGPASLKSNWPNLEAGPAKKPRKPLWFIDVDNVSVYKAESVAMVRRALRLFPGGVIRCYLPSEEEVAVVMAERREMSRQGVIIRR